MQNIDRLKPQDVKTAGDGKHNDGGYLWLYVRGTSKSWVLRTPRIDGKQRSMGLGSTDRVSLAQARRLRDDLLAKVQDGRDPLTEKRQAKKDAANRKTFRQAAEALIDESRERWTVSYLRGRSSTLDQWRHDVDAVFKPINDMWLDDITRDDIKPLLQAFWRKGCDARAKAILARIAAVFDFAVESEWTKRDNPARRGLWTKTLQAHSTPKENHDALSWLEVPAFVARLRVSDAVSARILEFCILTATRSQEARGARWSEIDLNRKVWTIPGERMKTALRHEVPLSDQAIALLRRMQPETGQFVFPGGRGDDQGDKPMRNQSLWNLVQRLATADATVHGFRSSFTIWAKKHGINADLRERCLAHEDSDEVRRAYGGIARDQLTEERRPIMDAWARFVDGAKDDDNIIRFPMVA